MKNPDRSTALNQASTNIEVFFFSEFKYTHLSYYLQLTLQSNNRYFCQKSITYPQFKTLGPVLQYSCNTTFFTSLHEQYHSLYRNSFNGNKHLCFCVNAHRQDARRKGSLWQTHQRDYILLSSSSIWWYWRLSWHVTV